MIECADPEFMIVWGVLAVLLMGVTIAAPYYIRHYPPAERAEPGHQEAGGRRFSARAEVNSKDEIEVLAEGFNTCPEICRMISKIKEDEQKIRKADLVCCRSRLIRISFIIHWIQCLADRGK